MRSTIGRPLRNILQIVEKTCSTAQTQTTPSQHNTVIRRCKGTSSNRTGALDAAIKGKKKNINNAPASKTDAGLSSKAKATKRYNNNNKPRGIRYTDANPPPIIPSPPPPPPRRGIRRYIWPVTMAGTIALFAFIYSLGNDEDDEFWKDVETGRILLDDDDEDDDDEEDEEE